MLTLLLIFNLIQISYTEFLGYCDYILNKEECIENVFCGWCNVTHEINKTFIVEESCIYKNTCSNFFNDTSCIVKEDRYSSCSFIISMANVILVLLYVSLSYTLIYSFQKLLDFNKNKTLSCIIVPSVITVVFVPSFILSYYNSSYFLPYLLALILVTLLACIFSSSYIYKKKNELRYTGYTPIQTTI